MVVETEKVRGLEASGRLELIDPHHDGQGMAARFFVRVLGRGHIRF